MIVQDNEFISDGGVGAVVVDKKQYSDPMDSFYKADNYFNEWKVRKDREKTLKQAQLQSELKDYSFDDKGADPLHAQEFIADKKRLEKGTAELLGMKRGTPEYAQKAYQLKAEADQLKTKASASAEELKIKNNQIKELHDNIDRYDYEKSIKALAERNALPISEQLKLATTPFLVLKNTPISELIQKDLYGKDSPLTKAQKYVTPTKDGHIVTGEKFTNDMGLESMNKYLQPNTKAYDSAMMAYEEAQSNPMYAGLIAQAKDPKINTKYSPIVYFAHHAFAPNPINGVTKYELSDEAKSAMSAKEEYAKGYNKVKGENKAKNEFLLPLAKDRADLLNMNGGYWIKDEKDPNKKYLSIPPNNISNDDKNPQSVTSVEGIKRDGVLEYKYRTTESKEKAEEATKAIADGKGTRATSQLTGLTYDKDGYVVNGDGSPITDPTIIDKFIYPLADQEIKPIVTSLIDEILQKSGGSRFTYNVNRDKELTKEPVLRKKGAKEENNNKSNQLTKTLSSGRIVYSDDNGKTWHP